MPVIITEYPKWINGVIVESEDHEIEIETADEKDAMVSELEKDYGKKVDLRSYKGSNGFGALKAYYEAVISRESSEED